MMIDKGYEGDYWCPFARGYEPDNRGGGVSINRPATNMQGEISTRFACIGSNCMAWRWIPADEQRPHRQLGYCGLAGKPECE